MAPARVSEAYSDYLYSQLLFPSGEAFFGGYYGVLLHQPSDGGAAELTTISNTYWHVQSPPLTPDDVWAVNENGQVARWQGQWTLVANLGAPLDDVWTSGPEDVWAVGEGVVFQRDPTTSTWGRRSLPGFDAGTDSVAFFSVCGHDGHDLLLVGQRCPATGCAFADERGILLYYRR